MVLEPCIYLTDRKPPELVAALTEVELSLIRNTGFQRPYVSPRRMAGREHGPGRLSKRDSFGYACPGSRLNEVFRYLAGSWSVLLTSLSVLPS